MGRQGRAFQLVLSTDWMFFSSASGFAFEASKREIHMTFSKVLEIASNKSLIGYSQMAERSTLFFNVVSCFQVVELPLCK